MEIVREGTKREEGLAERHEDRKDVLRRLET
jgi:hypothetical protein